MELIEKLGLDWKLLLAQVVNFLILLVILYKAAYKPVLQALEKRSKMIEKGIHDARASEEKLTAVEKLTQEKIAVAERTVGELIQGARTDADTIKKDLIVAAHAQSEEMLNKARLQMKEEHAKMLEDVRHEVTAIVIQATAKMLEREFSTEDQKRLLTAISKEMKTTAA